jgi:hypothetical protein
MNQIEHIIRFATPLQLVVDVAGLPPEPSGAVLAIVTARLDGGFALTARGPTMAYTLPDGKQVGLQIAYEDAEGNAATVDGAVAWSSANEDIAHVIVEGSDGKDVTLLGLKVGSTQITATADADLGDGVRNLITTLDVDVVAGEAVAGSITPTGEPETIPK